MALRLLVASRPQLTGGTFLEAGVGYTAQGNGGASARLGFFGLRIAPKRHPGQGYPWRPLGSFEIQRLHSPKRHAPLLGADAVLCDPSALATGAGAEAEAGQGVVEDEEFTLARRER
jgi:hypothetical protein